MTHRERFVRVLTGQPADRVPFIKLFGGDNAIEPAWEREYPGIGRCIDEVLQFEGGYRGWRIAAVNMDMASRGKPVETELPGGRTLSRWEDGLAVIGQEGCDFHSQVVEWPVKTRQDWLRVKARHLQPDDPDRWPADWSEWVQGARVRDYPLQLTHRGVYGFARNLMGDERLAYAFYDDPALVHEIMEGYTDFALTVWERMVRDVDFDLIEFWEDMASRNGALISPATFREFMRPQYRKVAEFARRHGIRILLVDSDGFIEGLTALMVEAGVTALYPYEVQAGNDVAKMLDRYPNLGVIGGLNKNAMAQGREAIDREMEKARRLIRKGRFIPGPDHFVLSDVPFANYRYFMEQLREVCYSTRPEPGS